MTRCSFGVLLKTSRRAMKLVSGKLEFIFLHSWATRENTIRI